MERYVNNVVNLHSKKNINRLHTFGKVLPQEVSQHYTILY